MGKRDGSGLSKARGEVSAFLASLGKGQVHIHSLEKTSEQRTKENKELTRIWDDLISQLEKFRFHVLSFLC